MIKDDVLLDEFLTWFEHTRGRSSSTVNSYRLSLLRLSGFLADYGLCYMDVDRVRLDEFVGPWAHEEGIALRSRRPLIASVRAFFQFLEQRNYRDDDPGKYLVYPNVGRKLPKVIPRFHVEDLIKTCDVKTLLGARDAAIMGLLVGLGLRVSGVTQLNLESLSLDQLDDGRMQLMITVVEKGKKERIIPVPSASQGLLVLYLQHPEYQALMTGDDLLLPNGEKVLFVQCNRGSTGVHEWFGEKRRLSSRSVQQMLVRRGTCAGVPREYLNPHSMRHFFGTEMAERDVDLRRIQMLMGHSSVDTTTLYIHTSKRKLATVMEEASPIQHLDLTMSKLAKQLPNTPRQLQEKGL